MPYPKGTEILDGRAEFRASCKEDGPHKTCFQRRILMLKSFKCMGRRWKTYLMLQFANSALSPTSKWHSIPQYPDAFLGMIPKGKSWEWAVNVMMGGGQGKTWLHPSLFSFYFFSKSLILKDFKILLKWTVFIGWEPPESFRKGQHINWHK